MNSSIFEIFKIGIGPSSSHTVGPMIISNKFINLVKHKNMLLSTTRIKITLYGSLAATGLGHSTNKAVLLGLNGSSPQNIDTSSINTEFNLILKNNELKLIDNIKIPFVYGNDLEFSDDFLEYHSNAIKLIALDINNKELINKTYYSIGGGYVLDEDEINLEKKVNNEIPYNFSNAKELITLCKQNNLSISQLIFQNEKAFRSENEINTKLNEIWNVMKESIDNGCNSTGLLPGHLKVPKRANDLYQKLSNNTSNEQIDTLEVLDWVNLYALAVNEENASGGRVVTAPTNGAAGIIPAVLLYLNTHINNNIHVDDMNVINNFLLTAGAIAMLYSKNASISGADVGCQGEVGVACSMAAGALAQALGADVDKVENAAEIGMEHNLGLTCDPIGGYVQIPCIERNAMASVKAINAARMAINGTGHHYVSLDSVIKTMFITGKDMQSKYKETSKGGLAVNAVEC